MKRLAIITALVLPVLALANDDWWQAVVSAQQVEVGPVAPTYPASIYRYEWAEQTNALGFYADTSAVGTNYGVSGTGTARPTWQAPYRLAFDGGDWVRGTNWAALSSRNVTAVTMVAWVNLRSTADGQYFASYLGEGVVNGFGTTGGKYFIQIGGPVFYGPTPSTTNWTHVAVAWASNTVAYVWTNGYLATTGAHAGAYVNWAGTGEGLRIGARPDGTANFFFGRQGEFMVFTNFATTAEVDAHYQSTKARFE